MGTDNDFYDWYAPLGWHTSADAGAFAPTPEWHSSNWPEAEHNAVVHAPPRRRYVQPAVLFLPLALLVRLWRWLKTTAKRA